MAALFVEKKLVERYTYELALMGFCLCGTFIEFDPTFEVKLAALHKLPLDICINRLKKCGRCKEVEGQGLSI